VPLHQQFHRLAGRTASLVLDLKHVQKRRQHPKGRAILRYQQGIPFHKPELMARRCRSKVTAVINRALPSPGSSRFGTAGIAGIGPEISALEADALVWGPSPAFVFRTSAVLGVRPTRLHLRDILSFSLFLLSCSY
jgi:hypothetical protein